MIHFTASQKPSHGFVYCCLHVEDTFLGKARAAHDIFIIIATVPGWCMQCQMCFRGYRRTRLRSNRSKGLMLGCASCRRGQSPE